MSKWHLTAIWMAAFFALSAQNPLDTARSRFATIDDVTLHYKIAGKGDPLIFLHGSMESMDDWSKQVPDFAKRYRVITMDNRGHGRSTFTDRKLDYQLFSEDVVALMNVLNIDSAYLVGFGDGGIVGLYLAINHPDKVRKLVAIGANYKVDTSVVYHEVLEKVQAWNDDKVYAFVRNHFRGWPNQKLLSAFTARMKTLLLTEPNLSIQNLQAIRCPTLFVTGDHDIIKLSHTNEMYEAVPQGYLAVIPGTRHYPQKEKPQLVNTMLADFLKDRFVKLHRF